MPEQPTTSPDGGAAGPVGAAHAFAERFDMLQGSGQLGGRVRASVESFLDEIARHFGVQVDEDHASQFATHVALAFSRIAENGDPVAPSAVVAAEVADRARERDFVNRALEERTDVLGPVSDAEADYLTVHVCALVDGQGA